MDIKSDLLNKQFHYWTVIGVGIPKRPYRKCWKCQCQCGNIREIETHNLTSGQSKSCGCLRFERASKNNGAWTGYNELSGSHWATILNNAKTRNISVFITIKEAWDQFVKQGRKCALSGIELKFSTRRRKMIQDTTASLDRIDSSKAYTIDNIQWVHKETNLMKRGMINESFIQWCKQIAKYNS